MPPEVAKKIVIKYTSAVWVENPVAKAWLSTNAMCDDQAIYPMPFEEMRIVWDPWFVEIRGRKVSLLCGSAIGLRFKVPAGDEQEDLIDAFLSLGAKVKVAKDAK